MQQVAEWLKDLGMPEDAGHFAENRIDVSVLPDLTEQHLKGLDVALGDRLKMLRAIRDLGNVSVAAGAPSTPVATEPTQRADAERRRLTVMLCDLVDSTALSTRLDPEEMQEIIAASHRCCAVQVTKSWLRRFWQDSAERTARTAALAAGLPTTSYQPEWDHPGNPGSS